MRLANLNSMDVDVALIKMGLQYKGKWSTFVLPKRIDNTSFTWTNELICQLIVLYHIQRVLWNTSDINYENKN